MVTWITPRGATVPILMYHYIRAVPGPADRVGVGLSVVPETFAAQMEYLARQGYRPVTVRQLYWALRGVGDLPSRPVVLTFDDGYADFATAAWPVLRRHGFPNTISVITGLVDRPGYLTRAMLTELHHSGLVEIGSHTVSHADLTALSPDRLRREVADSRQTLETWLGAPIETFCYPAGRYHVGVQAAVRAAGYRVALTTRPGVGHDLATALEWRRVRISGPGSVAHLAVALSRGG